MKVLLSVARIGREERDGQPEEKERGEVETNDDKEYKKMVDRVMV